MDKHEAERLVEEYGDMVFRLAYAKTGNRQDAEDVTQEVFLRLLRKAPSILTAAITPNTGSYGSPSSGPTTCSGPAPADGSYPWRRRRS